MRFEVAKALAVSMIALAAAPAMAGPSTAASPAPPDTTTDTATPTDEPTETPTDTDTDTTTGTDTPAPQKCAPLGDPDSVYGPRSGPIPRVVGRTKEKAKAELEQGGFGMDARPPSATADWIVRRQIQRGDAPCGSTVVIYLEAPTDTDTNPLSCAPLGDPDSAAGPKSGPVPTVVQNTTKKAKGALKEGGFRTKVKPSDAASDWIVRRQVPSGGTRAPCGSTVTLYLRPATPNEAGQNPDVVDPSKADSSSSTEPPGWLVPTAVAVAAGAGAWAVRRALRGPRPAPAAAVVCVPCVDPAPGVEVRDPAPTAGVTFVCHHDQGRQEIREIVR
ncbi:PASTA domain-containing protein [Nonomuraea guangzhouensis]|uniref:PASTA domain-containing protein n=1 Tax=Nonomuraea guangzhouensis TaxID=1291555 RepID=A0ABW4G329_9ACTN|nr:PASTA domain-containing protein [Nonomuraea guangzhouensis]